MKKILIWGTGDRANAYIKAGYFKDCMIKGFIDTYGSAGTYQGYDVYRPAELARVYESIDYIVIANEFYEEILQQCERLGIGAEKVVLTDNIQLRPYHGYYLRLKDVAEGLFDELEKKPSILVRANEYDHVDTNMLLSKGRYSRAIYMEDYFRFRTFELVAEQIKQSGVPGDIAELGVFRGTFAALINAHFSDRTLYLFDTFDGFGNAEAIKELEQGRCDERFLIVHKDTTEDRVLSALPHPEKARICKGLFPDTITSEAADAGYAFVSIDVDMEESTYSGLEFFYPRLAEGGMIFVHDHHTYYLEGVKEAVDRYEKKLGCRLKKVPIADRAGTLIVIK